MKKMRTVIIIAPHQDDEIIGCGGTIIKLIESGYRVYVQHIYSGLSGVKGMTNTEAVKLRNDEALEAAKIAKYTVLPNLGVEDRKNDSVSYIAYLLTKVFREISPELIFAPHENEQDYEHQVVSKACWEASWLANAEIYPEFPKKGNNYSPKMYLGYEVWRPIEKIGVFEDISAYVNQKIRLLEVFRSQMTLTSWVEGSIGLNAYRGTMLMGRGYAEAFTVRSLDPSSITSIKKQK